MIWLRNGWKTFFDWYNSLNDFLRIFLIPCLIAISIAGRVFMDCWVSPILAFTVITTLSIIQSLLTFSEFKLTSSLKIQANVFRIMSEAMNSLVGRKVRLVSTALQRHPDSVRVLVKEIAERNDFRENAIALNGALHGVVTDLIRGKKNLAAANVVTALMSPNEAGGFDLIDQAHTATGGNLESKTRLLKQKRQNSLACALFNADTSDFISASNVKTLEQRKQFSFFGDNIESKFTKSIAGYRVVIDKNCKFIWTIDVDHINALPDSYPKTNDHNNRDYYVRLNEIFVAFKYRIIYEYYLDKISKMVKDEK